MTDLELEALNALDVLAVLTECRPGNVRLGALDTLTRALKVMRREAQALADVRTLDDWAAQGAARAWFVFYSGHGFECAGEHMLSGETLFEFASCATPDEARAKAAVWVREQAKKGA